MSQAWAFLATLVLEVPVAIAMTRWLGSPRRSWWAWALAAAVIGSAVTHPMLWWAGEAWALPAGSGWPIRMVVLELAVALVEAIFYGWLCRLSAGRALATSAVTNAASFIIGLGIQALVWAAR